VGGADRRRPRVAVVLAASALGVKVVEFYVGALPCWDGLRHHCCDARAA
jgi:hypothetical protein